MVKTRDGFIYALSLLATKNMWTLKHSIETEKMSSTKHALHLNVVGWIVLLELAKSYEKHE